MNDDFQYPCRRRSARREPVIARSEFLGAGSGGDDGGHTMYIDETLYVNAAHILLSAHDAAQNKANVVSLLAGAEDGNGRVEVHGGTGVRITAGPPGQPDASNEYIQGVEIETDEGDISLSREPLGGYDSESIYLGRNRTVLQACAGMLIDFVQLTGLGMTISSTVSIQLKVGDLTSITLTDKGIIMKGPIIDIN